MHAALAVHRGLVVLGRHRKTAEVRLFDLGGRLLGGGFAFRDERAGRSSCAALAVDSDRRIWVADAPAGCVRAFTVGGREILKLAPTLAARSARDADPRASAALCAPVALAVREAGDELLLAVATYGDGRCLLQLLDPSGIVLATPRPPGHPVAHFRDVRALAFARRELYVADAGRGAVQVFRDMEYFFSIALPRASGQPAEPVGIAPLDDGRLVVLCGGRAGVLWLVDRSGSVRRVLARAGQARGELDDPTALAVAAGSSDRDTLAVVADQSGLRVQVFTLEGRALGVFDELAV
jgi:hypothetical protein